MKTNPNPDPWHPDPTVVARFARPHPALLEWVSHYWELSGECPPSQPRSMQRLLPGLNAAIIVQLATPVDVRSEGGGFRRRPTAFAEGHFHYPFQLRFEGRFRLIGASFVPGRIHLFLRDSQAYINDRFVDLSEAVDPRLRGLPERLHRLTFEEAAGALDQVLLSLRPLPDPQNGGLYEAMRLAVRRPFASTVDDMARVACLSTRQLERRFNDTVGLSPKYFSRVARFDRFIRHWTMRPDRLLTTLAHDSGYFDQAHFNREFRKFTAESPTSYLAKDHFVASAINRMHAEVEGWGDTAPPGSLPGLAPAV